MELLSPAGNAEALKAAISCGADAVYLGYTAFGARSFAGNFDAEGLRDAIAYAHDYGRKIYVTVNTLVKTDEIGHLYETLSLLDRLGADAILVQDMGVAQIARDCFPGLTLHASTQMTVNNAQGARFLKAQGFSRVVPARECSLDELRRMADEDVEVEAFAHGALCVAVSGQCLFSSMIGGRSGNRGKCAQPCRLPYRLENGRSGYLLSTKDLMLIDRIPEMRDAGVFSFKLEGRMKRPEYVGVITRAYRQALDAAERHEPYRLTETTLSELRQVFNRGGFTEGYVMGQSNAALMSWEKPNHWGVPVGQTVTDRKGGVCVSASAELMNGDALQARGRTELDFTYTGPELPAGGRTAPLQKLRGVEPGTPVYRLTSEKQMREIRKRIEAGPARVPVDACLTAREGELPVLVLRDDLGNAAEAVGEQPVQAASRHPMTYEDAEKQLSKLGDTAYTLRKLTVDCGEVFVPSGVLNALRRNAAAALSSMRTALPEKTQNALPDYRTDRRCTPELAVQSGDLSEASACFDAGAEIFYWQPDTLEPEALSRRLDQAGPKGPVALVLPGVTYSRELDALYEFVLTNRHRLCGVVLNNIGHLGMRWPVRVFGGQGLNTMNPAAARYCESHGVERLTVSCELTGSETAALLKSGGSYELEAYGRTQLMLLSHCPGRTDRGDTVQDTACRACERNGGCPAVYEDRMHYRFPVYRSRMPHGCVLRLYNSVPTDLSRHEKALSTFPGALRLTFTDETPERRLELVRSFRSFLDNGKALHQTESGSTSGHWMRGIE